MQLKRRQFVGALGAAAAATAATLQPAYAQGVKAPDPGIDYKEVNPPQATDSPGKIEVIEFMWYGCPHCYAFEPALTSWLQRLPGDVAFKRVPAQFSQVWVQHAKLFYALDALGEENRLHKKAFDAIHVGHMGLDQEGEMIDWAGKNGVDKAKFTEALKSFGVAGKLRRAAQMVTSYQIDGVPAMAINGRYLTAPSMVGSQDRALQVVDYLIEIERKKKRT
jgi:protein dithiol oxidoreductase (disulfide-forming)